MQLICIRPLISAAESDVLPAQRLLNNRETRHVDPFVFHPMDTWAPSSHAFSSPKESSPF